MEDVKTIIFSDIILYFCSLFIKKKKKIKAIMEWILSNTTSVAAMTPGLPPEIWLPLTGNMFKLNFDRSFIS